MLDLIKQHSRGWRRDRLKPFPELRFTYEEGEKECCPCRLLLLLHNVCHARGAAALHIHVRRVWMESEQGGTLCVGHMSEARD